MIIKLNGGLGTSMGMDKAKSLLRVREDKTFLDLIVDQVRAARAAYGVKLPLVFMNSFRTHDDTLDALSGYPDLAVDGLELDFVQSQEPKLRADDLSPVEWPADPTLEWCPPGHGDLYPSLSSSGVLDRLLGLGYRYASVSNSDNLGAAPDATIAGWFAARGAPYAAEICRRTAADRKGGHLAVRRSDQQLILRDTAQTAPEEMHFFTDEHRHPYFHCNNLWFDLEVLARTLAERDSVLGLPLIRNEKTVDPADSSVARGRADRECDGCGRGGLPRRHGDRGRPGAVPAGQDDQRPAAAALGRLPGQPGRPAAARRGRRRPLVDLDPGHYKTIGAFEQRFPDGAPSLVRGGVADRTRGLDLRGRRGRPRCGQPGRREADPGSSRRERSSDPTREVAPGPGVRADRPAVPRAR